MILYYDIFCSPFSSPHVHQPGHDTDPGGDHDSARDAETFLLLPILVNILLITANLLAAWGAITFNHLFLVPWLAAYFSYILFAFGLLLYMVIVLHHVWFKIVLFLIVSPILILAIVFWLTVLELYFIVKLNKPKEAHTFTLQPNIYFSNIP